MFCFFCSSCTRNFCITSLGFRDGLCDLAALLEALALQPEVAIPAGPLLLVDARYRSGWSATVAASLLREAGASTVLPLVLHQLP